ncbi:Outer membrane protein assembly factor YaeT [hydrothermal vent metagenome]|uniref:Outer membrane protein assembly factor YaeT n=1 Tax=hydrothermal vent metagenome TaxID=652676 RepID=A0A3B0TCX1_9ZZZZ
MTRTGKLGTGLTVAIFLMVSLVMGIADLRPAMAQGVVRDIVVEGNRRIEDETVRSYMRIGRGDAYDPALVNDSLKALFATGLFADVTISRRKGTLIVKVVENPIINRVAFEGNQKFDNEQLAKEIQSRSRTVFTRARVQADVQRLVTLYRRAGRFATTIEPKIIRKPQDRVDLVFEINEGVTTEISRINFIGNRAFSDGDLRDVIITDESSWWDEIIGRGSTYDPDRMNFDRELLRRHYLKNGYADFRVVSAVAELDRQQSQFFITFTVDEGEQYKFGAIDIDSSLTSLPLDFIDGEILTEEGDTYDATQIDKTVENLTIEAGKLGFAFVKVRPRPQRDRDAKTIGITYLIDDGPRVYVERINVRGNIRTLDSVIRREFRLAEGDAFNRALIVKARRDLQALGFFATVKITTEEGSRPDRVIINVDVEEKSTGEVSFGLGYSSVDAVVGNIQLTERNLLGRGQYLRLQTQLSGDRQQIDLRFTEPYFLGRRLTFGVDLFGNETDSTDTSSFKSNQLGAGVRFGFPLGEDLFLNTKYSLTRDEIFDVDLATASLSVQQAVGESIVSLVGYTLTYNTLDNQLKPTEGIRATFSQELAGLGGDVNYLRTQASAATYYQFMPDIVGSLKVSGGNIEPWDDQEVRILDAFFKGSDLVRGFERSGLGPRDAATGDALGGTNFVGTSAEVRFPFYGIPEEFGITGAAFVDAGTVFGTPASGGATVNDISDIRAAAGVSIIWDSPLGPLRADFSEPFLSQSFDETKFFQFSGGFKF